MTRVILSIVLMRTSSINLAGNYQDIVSLPRAHPSTSQWPLQMLERNKTPERQKVYYSWPGLNIGGQNLAFGSSRPSLPNDASDRSVNLRSSSLFPLFAKPFAVKVTDILAKASLGLQCDVSNGDFYSLNVKLSQDSESCLICLHH